MDYLIQKCTFFNLNPLTEEEWQKGENWINKSRYYNQENAIYRLEHDSNLARIVWAMRVVTSENKLIMGYDPELDTRLPGCRWRTIQRNAYYLWEAAGKPDNEEENFWHQAEQELKHHNGIVLFGK